MKSLSTTIGIGNSIISLDTADLIHTVRGKSACAISMAEGSSPAAAALTALKLIGKFRADSAFIQIEGGATITVEHYMSAAKVLAAKLPKNAKIIYGVKMKRSLGKKSRVLIILAGKGKKNK